MLFKNSPSPMSLDPKGLTGAQQAIQLSATAKPFVPPPAGTQQMPSYPNGSMYPPPPPGTFNAIPPQSQYPFNPMVGMYYTTPFFPPLNPGEHLYSHPQAMQPQDLQNPQLSSMQSDFSQSQQMLPFSGYPPYPGTLPPQNQETDENGIPTQQNGMQPVQSNLMYSPYDPMTFPAQSDPNAFNMVPGSFVPNQQMYSQYHPMHQPPGAIHPNPMDPSFPPLHQTQNQNQNQNQNQQHPNNKFTSKNYLATAQIDPDDVEEVLTDDDTTYDNYQYDNDNSSNIYSVETLYSMNPLVHRLGATAIIDQIETHPAFNTFLQNIDQNGTINTYYPHQLESQPHVRDFVLFCAGNTTPVLKDARRILNQYAQSYYTQYIETYQNQNGVAYVPVLDVNTIVEQGIQRANEKKMISIKKTTTDGTQNNQSPRQPRTNDNPRNFTKDATVDEYTSMVLDDSDDDNVLYSTETGVRKPHYTPNRNAEMNENGVKKTSFSARTGLRGDFRGQGGAFSRSNMGHDADELAEFQANKAQRRQQRADNALGMNNSLNNIDGTQDDMGSEKRQTKRTIDADDDLFSRDQMGTIQVQLDENGNPIVQSRNNRQQNAAQHAASTQPRRQLGVDNVNVTPSSKDSEKWRVVGDRGKRGTNKELLDQKFRGNLAATDWLSQVRHHFQILLNKLTIQRFHEVSHDIAFQIMCYATPQTQDKFKQSAEIAALLIFDHALKNPNFAYAYTYLCKVLSENLPASAISAITVTPASPGIDIDTKKAKEVHQFHGKFIATITEGLSIVSNYIQDAQSIQNPTNPNAPLLVYVAEHENEDNIKKQQRFLAYVKFFAELYRCGLIPQQLLSDCLSKLRLVTFDEFSGAVNKTGPVDKNDKIDVKIEFARVSYESLLAWNVLLLHCGAKLEQEYPHLGHLIFKKIKTLSLCKQITSLFRFKFLDLIALRTKNWVSDDPAFARPIINSTMTSETIMIYDEGDSTSSPGVDGMLISQGHNIHKKKIEEKKIKIAKTPTTSLAQAVVMNVLTATDSAGNAVSTKTTAATGGGNIFQRALLARKQAAAAAASASSAPSTPSAPSATPVSVPITTPVVTVPIIVAPVIAPTPVQIAAPITITPSIPVAHASTTTTFTTFDNELQWKPNFSSRVDLINYQLVLDYSNLASSRWDPIRNAIISSFSDYLGSRDVGEINYTLSSIANKPDYQDLLSPYLSTARLSNTSTKQLLQVHLPVFFAVTFIIHTVQKRHNASNHLRILPEVIFQYRRLVVEKIDFSGITKNSNDMFVIQWNHVIAALTAGIFANYDELMEEIPLLFQFLPLILAHFVGTIPEVGSSTIQHIPLSFSSTQLLCQLFFGTNPPLTDGTYVPLFDIQAFSSQFYGVLSLLKANKSFNSTIAVPIPEASTIKSLFNHYFATDVALCGTSVLNRTAVIQQFEQMQSFLISSRQYYPRFLFTSQSKYLTAKEHAPLPPQQNRINNRSTYNYNENNIPVPLHVSCLSLLNTLSISLFLSGPLQDSSARIAEKDNLRRYSAQAVPNELEKLNIALFLTGQQFWTFPPARVLFDTEILQPDDATVTKSTTSPNVLEVVNAIRGFAKVGPITNITFFKFCSRNFQTHSKDTSKEQLLSANNFIISQFVAFVNAIISTKF